LFRRNDWQLDPLHYLTLIERKIASFESARPILQWRSRWPEIYENLLARLIHRDGATNGRREFVRVLQLHREHPAGDVEKAVARALECGTCRAAAVKHLLLAAATPPAIWVPLPAERIPGVTDRVLAPPDMACYGALLEGRRE
jgi:hypothetical protein